MRFCCLFICCILSAFIIPLSGLATPPNKSSWQLGRLDQVIFIHKKENNINFTILLKGNDLPTLQVALPSHLMKRQYPNTLLIKFDHRLFTLLHTSTDHVQLYKTTLNNEQYQQFKNEFTSQKTAYVLLPDIKIPISLQGTRQFIEILNSHDIKVNKHSLYASVQKYLQSHFKLNFFEFITIIFIFFMRKTVWKMIQSCILAHKRKKAFTLAVHEIEKNALPLSIKRNQLIYKDDYGTVITDKWMKEMQRFIKTRIKPVLSQAHLLKFLPSIQNRLINKINKTARSHHKKKQGILFSEKITPLEYETLCAQLLRQIGWDANVTIASGDQGADVIAVKNNKKLILQCKLYKKPVGNKAVQEINAARQFYQADYGAVVSSASYTISARQLASTTHIALLHHETLQEFAKRL